MAEGDFLGAERFERLGIRHGVLRVLAMSPGAAAFIFNVADAEDTLTTRGLTLELSCLLRQTVPGRGREDATGPWSGQATAAVAGQLERRVRPRRG